MRPPVRPLRASPGLAGLAALACGVLLLVSTLLVATSWSTAVPVPAPQTRPARKLRADTAAFAVPAALTVESAETIRALRLRDITVEALSWKPRIFRLHSLLTPEECDALVAQGRPALEASTVVDGASGEGAISTVRTSTGTFLTEGTPTTKVLRQRIAHLTMLPEENQEAISVLRYQLGQYYRPHQDWFADQHNINRGGQRVATVLMYLTDVEGGGETIFPQAGGAGAAGDCGGESSRGLAVTPKKGDAVLFWTGTPGGKEDGATMHGGCAVTAGEKWSATIWIRSGKFT